MPAAPSIRVSDLIAPHFADAWRDMRAFAHDEYWLPGGRGSTKSTLAALRVVYSIARDPLANAVCFRRHKVDVADSVYADIEKTAFRLGWHDLFAWSHSPHRVTYLPTGQQILFRGLDSADKSKSITCSRGYLQTLWFEEYDQYDGQRDIDKVIQSVGRGGPRFQVLCTYNPPETNASWVNAECARPVPNRLVVRSDYRGVNPDWLGPAFFRKMEQIRAVSEQRYRHEYLGEVTGTGGEVFRNLVCREVADEEIAGLRTVRWGMDFGQVDPTVLSGSAYDPRTDTLFVFDEWYRSDVYTWEVMEAIASRGLEYAPIMADPGGGGKTVVKDLRGAGARGIRQAYKPAGSVEKGVRWLRERTAIVIDPARCPNHWREFSRYEFDRLRDGSYRNEYPDRDNHAIDAVRYAWEDEIFRGGRSRLLGY